MSHGIHVALWPGLFSPPAAKFPENTHFAGFLLSKDEQPEFALEIKGFLDRHPRPVVITAGSGRFAGEAFYRLALGAVEKLLVPGIVITSHADLLPARLPEACLWVPRVPAFAALIARASAIIHHGGTGSVGQVISAGIPQLILPVLGDHPVNGQRVQDLGLGISLLRLHWTESKVSDALATVLGSHGIPSKCLETASALAGLDSEAAVCGILERAAMRDRLRHLPLLTSIQSS